MEVKKGGMETGRFHVNERSEKRERAAHFSREDRRPASPGEKKGRIVYSNRRKSSGRGLGRGSMSIASKCWGSRCGPASLGEERKKKRWTFATPLAQVRGESWVEKKIEKREMHHRDPEGLGISMLKEEGMRAIGPEFSTKKEFVRSGEKRGRKGRRWPPVRTG